MWGEAQASCVTKASLPPRHFDSRHFPSWFFCTVQYNEYTDQGKCHQHFVEERFAMPSGRTRQFDADDALDRAVEVFSARGYEGATLLELTEAMGINRPSLYAAFGNKEQLFRKALAHYLTASIVRGQGNGEADGARRGGGPVSGVCPVAAQQPPITRMPDRVRGPRVRRGGQPVHQDLAALREAAVQAIRQRFERAVRENDSQGVGLRTLARYVVTVLNGLAVQAVSGATDAELRQVSKLALQIWPG